METEGRTVTGRESEEDLSKYQTDYSVILTFKCHVYIKKCFRGILITLVNSRGDVKWIRGAPGGRRGTEGEEETVREKTVGLTDAEAAWAR